MRPLGELTRMDEGLPAWSEPKAPDDQQCKAPMGWVDCEVCGPDDGMVCNLAAGHAGSHEAYSAHDGSWLLPDDAP